MSKPVIKAKCIECGRRIGVYRRRLAENYPLIYIHRHITPSGDRCLSHIAKRSTMTDTENED